jgi:NAD(P) transhydrogenase subunit alpha
MTDTQTTVGVVRESGAGERRVALVPKAVAALVDSGVAVVIESGAGEQALLPDGLYTAAGATVGDAWAADVVVKVAPPTADEVARLRSGQTLIGFLAPRNADNQIDALAAAGVQAFALEAIPRISRAQVMDALSSQANVAGYKAVLLAASESTACWCWVWALPACRRWPPPNGWVAAPPVTTYVPKSPIRSVRWAHSGST